MNQSLNRSGKRKKEMVTRSGKREMEMEMEMDGG